MKSTKKLSLKKERLVELSNAQMAGLAGGVAATPICYTSTCECTKTCPSDNQQCASLDTCTCDCTYRTICGCHVDIGLA